MGKVLNIQRYSIHDGPGIRTTVFLKGCPLNCWWCHNPESKNPKDELMFFEDRCVGCGRCVEVCSENCLEIVDGKARYRYKELCNSCEKCKEFCYHDAIEYVGKDMTALEVTNELKKDRVFYEESKGGITVSGGEPLLQVDFSYDILKKCKEEGIHTVVDTSGYGSWEGLEKLATVTDLFLYDLKLIDDKGHRKYIGVSNKIILDNIKKLSDMDKNIFIRIPIIENINDGEKDIADFIKFISTLKNIEKVNLIPYHDMGKKKYERLELKYKLDDMKPPSEARMEEIKNEFLKKNLKVEIGG